MWASVRNSIHPPSRFPSTASAAASRAGAICFFTACAQAADRLAAIGVRAVRLDGDSLFATITDGFDATASWYEHPKYATIGDVIARGHALRRLPGHPVGAGWLAPLLSVQTECDIAVHMAPASLGEALGRLSRRLRDFSAHRMLEMERGALGDVHVDIGVDSATALRERLARNQGRPLHLSVIATVRGDSHDTVEARSAALRLGFASSLIGVEVTRFRHMAALMSTLPLGLTSLDGGKLVGTFNTPQSGGEYNIGLNPATQEVYLTLESSSHPNTGYFVVLSGEGLNRISQVEPGFLQRGTCLQ